MSDIKWKLLTFSLANNYYKEIALYVYIYCYPQQFLDVLYHRTPSVTMVTLVAVGTFLCGKFDVNESKNFFGWNGVVDIIVRSY